MSTVRTQLISIGNSRGLRLPKPMIEQVGLVREIEIQVEEDHLVIRAADRPRQHWDAQFRSMAERGDDRLLDEPAPTSFEDQEWQWR